MSKAVPLARLSKIIFDIGLFSIVINALLLVSPFYLMQIYDRVLPSASVATLIYISIAALLALVFLMVLEIVRTVYSQRIAAKLDRHFASRAFAASLLSPRTAVADIQPLRDLATARSFVASRGLTTLFDLPFVPLFVALLGFIHPALALLTLVGAIVMIVLVILTQALSNKSTTHVAEKSTQSNLMAQAFVRNAETIKAMGMTPNVTEAWGTLFGQAHSAQDSATSKTAVLSGISRATRMLLQLAIMGLGAWLILEGRMTAGMIFASSIISGRALQPLDQLIAGWRQTVDARLAWRRLKHSVPRQPTTRRIELPEVLGALTVRDLTYVPPGAEIGTDPILKQLSFDINAGESVAIVGASRAGKSTLARLLVGAISPTSGTIRIDGADLKTWNEKQLGRIIGYLAQDVQLLPGSIAQNVSRFDSNASDMSIVTAAERANAHGIIIAQRNGYQTDVGGNVNLSGGERQRIGLARAFYGEPKILVLDEPNANLDQEGEAALRLALANAGDAATTIVLITHRLALAATCDRILVLRAGAIEAFGSSADIMRQLGWPASKTQSAKSSSFSTSSSFTSTNRINGRWPIAVKSSKG